jgi:hypothetical protein
LSKLNAELIEMHAVKTLRVSSGIEDTPSIHHHRRAARRQKYSYEKGSAIEVVDEDDETQAQATSPLKKAKVN